MSSSHPQPVLPALRAVGPWLRDEAGAKFTLRGVTYGPFKPNSNGEPWPENQQLQADLEHITSLGFNAIRLYELPSHRLLQLCEKLQLRLLVGIPWTQHVDFLTDAKAAQDALDRVKKTAASLRHEATVAALIIGNEIEKTLVRWMGPERVRDFLEKLITAAHEAAGDKLVAYASYPSTEYLVPGNADFLAYNVFLEKPDAFEAYVQHLQNLAGDRPLVISEFGLDSRHHGETRQAEARHWQEQITQKAGIAGSFWFAYTDEWHRGGEEVTGWDFGLVQRDRTPKSACSSLHPSSFILHPSISVVVCTYNGSATLPGCLQALSKQSHPDYEVLLIDDGSTEDIAAIASAYAWVKYHRQEHAGLSAARNLGMQLARHEILAYTDDDCLPDEDWLLHISRAYDDVQWVAAGGPNLPPPPRNLTETCVARAPGGPSHVLLTDSEAEHLPGCNLSIRKSALEAIGGFRDEFKTAGDDVDVCWRLQAAGGKLRFVPSALVWHHRRFTVKAYLKQQRGYGHAEAMLIRRHGERFAWFGGARWLGAIYGDYHRELTTIQHGRHGLADFQCIYQYHAASLWHYVSGLPWITITFLMMALGFWSPFLWLTGGAMVVLTLLAAWRRTESMPGRMLLWWLCLLQPPVRDWARLCRMIQLDALPRAKSSWRWSKAVRHQETPRHFKAQLQFWSEKEVGRQQLLSKLEALARERGFGWHEAGSDQRHDAILSFMGASVLFGSVTEYHGSQRTLTRVSLKGIRARKYWYFYAVPFLSCLFCLAPTYENLDRFLVVLVAGSFILESLHIVVLDRVCRLVRDAAASLGLQIRDQSFDRGQNVTQTSQASPIRSEHNSIE